MSTSTPAPPIRTSSSAQTLKLLRKVHLYFGLFIAPALLFFAFTGAVQTLSLHESAGSTYTPPAWLARLGQLHKNQNIALPQKKAPRPEAPAAGASDHPQFSAAPAVTRPAPPPVTLATKQKRHLPEKLFFLAVSMGLFVSTLTGIYMAYRYERSRLLVTGILLAGIAIPLLLLPF